MRDLVLQPGIKPRPPALGVQSLTHCVPPGMSEKHHDYWFIFSDTSVLGREGPWMVSANISVTGKVEHLLKINPLKICVCHCEIEPLTTVKPPNLLPSKALSCVVLASDISNLDCSSIKGRRNSFEFNLVSLSLFTLWVKHWRERK